MPSNCGQAPAGARAAEGLEVPRPLRLFLTAGWSLTESVGLPAAAYVVAAWLDGRDAGLVARLAAIWLTAVIRKVATGSVPSLLRQPATHYPGLHRFFQGATWLWAGIFLLLTAGLAVLMVTERPACS